MFVDRNDCFRAGKDVRILSLFCTLALSVEAQFYNYDAFTLWPRVAKRFVAWR
jgi:hypothetical protein